MITIICNVCDKETEVNKKGLCPSCSSDTEKMLKDNEKVEEIRMPTIQMNDNEKLIVLSSTLDKIEVWCDNLGKIRVKQDD